MESLYISNNINSLISQNLPFRLVQRQQTSAWKFLQPAKNQETNFFPLPRVRIVRKDMMHQPWQACNSSHLLHFGSSLTPVGFSLQRLSNFLWSLYDDLVVASNNKEFQFSVKRMKEKTTLTVSFQIKFYNKEFFRPSQWK